MTGDSWGGKKVIDAQAKILLGKSEIKLQELVLDSSGHICAADGENQIHGEAIPLYPQEFATPWSIPAGQWRKEPEDLACLLTFCGTCVLIYFRSVIVHNYIKLWLQKELAEGIN